MTAAELAKFLNVPVAYVWKGAREGRLPHYRLPGGRKFIRFRKSEVMEVLRGTGEFSMSGRREEQKEGSRNHCGTPPTY